MKKRKGSAILGNMCDRICHCAPIEEEQEYDTASLAEVFKNNRRFVLKDLFYWLFGAGDWHGEPEIEEFVLHCINVFLAQFPEGCPYSSIDSLDPDIGNELREHFCTGRTWDEKEELKEAFLNIVIEENKKRN